MKESEYGGSVTTKSTDSSASGIASAMACSVPTRRLAKAVNMLTRVSAATAPMPKRMINCLIDAGVRSRCFFSWASVSNTVV